MERLPLPSSELAIVPNPEIESTKHEKFPAKNKPNRWQLVASIVAAVGYSAGFTWMLFKQNRTITGAFQADGFYLAAITSHSVSKHLGNKNSKLN